MSEVNLSELFGEPKKPDKAMQIATILQMLARLIGAEPDKPETVVEARAREIPVRPRVEPQGG
jgi:hypothetical protein